MRNSDCSKEKIINAYYYQSTNKETMEHISSCEECSKYYQDLVSIGERMNLLSKTDNSPDTFVAKRILNIHLSSTERKKIYREAIFFALTGFSLIGGLYGGMIAFDYRAVLIFYLIVFINLPVLLLPAILKRKELI